MRLLMAATQQISANKSLRTFTSTAHYSAQTVLVSVLLIAAGCAHSTYVRTANTVKLCEDAACSSRAFCSFCCRQETGYQTPSTTLNMGTSTLQLAQLDSCQSHFLFLNSQGSRHTCSSCACGITSCRYACCTQSLRKLLYV